MTITSAAKRALHPRRATRFIETPMKTQRRVLDRLLMRARDTTFGQENGFGALVAARDTVAAYQDRVALQTYDDLDPYLELTRAGHADVTWPGTIDRFAVSSGTVSAGKILPASKDLLRCMRRCSLELLQSYVTATRNYDILFGKLLAVSGRTEPGEVHGVVGEMSGLVRSAAPFWVKRYWHAVDESHLAIEDWRIKLTAIAASAGGADVRAIAMVPSWTAPLFEALIDMHRGRDRRSRATIGEIWPNLRVFFSSGVPLASYRHLLEHYLDVEGIHFIEMYTASEGFFAYQDRLDATDMLLHLDAGVFYEFVPHEDLGKTDRRRLTIDQVEPGKKYALYVTTCAGLWSYSVRDLVEFTSIAPHRIRVVGRTTEMLDEYGEALFAHEAREALDMACTLHGAYVAHAHVTYDRPSNTLQPPGHEWLIEFVNEPDCTDTFRQTLDALLCTANRHYQIRRQAGSVQPARVACLRRGTTARWLRRARTSVSAQTKVPFMSSSRAIAGQLAALSAGE